MEFETLKEWFSQQMKSKAGKCRTLGVLGFVACPIALTVAAGFVYALARLFTYKEGGPDQATLCLWIALGAVPVMFIGNLLTPRGESLMERRMREGAPMGGAANRGLVLSQVFLWIMFAGPRLVNWGIASFREAAAWEGLDAHSCAGVFWLLVSRHKKVAYEEFQAELPWLDLAAVVPQVSRVQGLLRLQGPPAGLSLTDDLRKTIRTGGAIE